MATVAKNLITLAASFGVTANPAKASFRLIGYEGTVPRITGAVLMVVLAVALADGSHNISVNLEANSDIHPANTAYEVTLYTSVGGFITIGKVHVLSNGSLEVL